MHCLTDYQFYNNHYRYSSIASKGCIIDSPYSSPNCIGQRKVHEEFAQEPVPILDTRNPQGEENSRTWNSLLNINADPPGTIGGRMELRNDNTTNPAMIPPDQGDFRGFTFDYERFLNPHMQFCELWIAKCPLVC